MSSPLQDNTAELQSILNMVNNLPLANDNGGGGSANVDTCTVDITFDFPCDIFNIFYLSYINGNFIIQHEDTYTDASINVIKDTMIVINGDFASCSGLDKSLAINTVYGSYYDSCQIFYAVENGSLAYY